MAFVSTGSLTVIVTRAGAEALSSAREFVLTAQGGGPYVPSVAEQRVLAALATAPRQELAVERLTSLKPRINGVLRILGELAARELCSITWDDGSDEAARVEMHYRRTDYLEPRRVLMERWAKHVTGQNGQVLQMVKGET